MWYEDTNTEKVLAAAEKGYSRFRIKPPAPHPFTPPTCLYLSWLAVVPMKLCCPLCIPSCSSYSQPCSSRRICAVMKWIGWGDRSTSKPDCFSLVLIGLLSRVGFSHEGKRRGRNGVSGLNAGLLMLQQCQSKSAKYICETVASDSIPGKDSLKMLL